MDQRVEGGLGAGEVPACLVVFQVKKKSEILPVEVVSVPPP